MTLSRVLPVVLIWTLLSSFDHASTEGIRFGNDLNAAIEEAKTNDKLIFLDAYASWCGPCKRMESQVFADPDLASYFNEHFVNVKVDFDRNSELRRAYKVTAYPTLFFLNSDGSVKKKYVGYRDVKELLQRAQKLED